MCPPAIAVLSPTKLHAPVPTEGLLPTKLVEVPLTVLSLPAVAVVGWADIVRFDPLLGAFVTGLDDIDAQMLVLGINAAISSEAFNPAQARYTRKGDAKATYDR